MHEREHRRAQHLGLGPAEDGREGRIDGEQRGMQVGHQHDVLRQAPHAVTFGGAAFDPFFQARIGQGQCVGRALLVFDVDAAADPERRFAGLARGAVGTHQMPAVLAVVAAQADFGVDRRARRHAGLPHGAVAFHVVWMHDRLPAQTQRIVGRRAAAGVLAHAVVDPFDAAVIVRRPHVVRHRLRKGAKARFARAQRALGVHPLGDVVAEHEGGEHGAVGVAQRLQHDVDEGAGRPVLAGIVQHQFDTFGAKRRAIGETAIELLDEAMRGQFGQGLRHRHAEQWPPAGQRAVGVVGQRVVVLGAVQQAHEARRLLEHRVQARALGLDVAFGLDLAGGLDHDRHDAGNHAILVADRRIVEVHPDLLGRAAAVQREFLIPVTERAARQADAHHVVVEGRYFGPAFAHFRAQQRWMAPAREHPVGVVVDHVAVLAPQRDDGRWRGHDQRDGRLEHGWPGVDRAEIGALPGVGQDQTRGFVDFGQEGQAGWHRG